MQHCPKCENISHSPAMIRQFNGSHFEEHNVSHTRIRADRQCAMHKQNVIVHFCRRMNNAQCIKHMCLKWYVSVVLTYCPRRRISYILIVSAQRSQNDSRKMCRAESMVDVFFREKVKRSARATHNVAIVHDFIRSANWLKPKGISRRLRIFYYFG